VPGALLGFHLVSRISSSDASGSDAFLTHVLGIVLLLAAGASLLRAAGFTLGDKTKPDPGPIATAGLGFGIGVLVGFTSIGAGSLLMAVFSLCYRRLSATQAVGADVMHGAILATVAAIAHGSAGHIEFTMLINLLAGSVPGVLLGGWLCSWMPNRPLRVGVAAMLAISGVRLL
jgi:uncharacterized membrane protein YfcA